MRMASSIPGLGELHVLVPNSSAQENQAVLLLIPAHAGFSQCELRNQVKLFGVGVNGDAKPEGEFDR